LRTIDDDELQRRAVSLQFEPALFDKCGKQIRAGIGCRIRNVRPVSSGRGDEGRHELDVKIVTGNETGPVDDGSRRS
jgi:hypothetical protein